MKFMSNSWYELLQNNLNFNKNTLKSNMSSMSELHMLTISLWWWLFICGHMFWQFSLHFHLWFIYFPFIIYSWRRQSEGFSAPIWTCSWTPRTTWPWRWPSTSQVVLLDDRRSLMSSAPHEPTTLLSSWSETLTFFCLFLSFGGDPVGHFITGKPTLWHWRWTGPISCVRRLWRLLWGPSSSEGGATLQQSLTPWGNISKACPTLSSL